MAATVRNVFRLVHGRELHRVVMATTVAIGAVHIHTSRGLTAIVTGRIGSTIVTEGTWPFMDGGSIVGVLTIGNVKLRMITITPMKGQTVVTCYVM